MRAALLVVCLLVASVSADLYLHNPRGINDRNRERNQQRQNANRLFNSQNNAQGGYPWAGDATVRAAPDAITYYTGSQVQLEWTNQHSCSPNGDANVCSVSCFCPVVCWSVACCSWLVLHSPSISLRFNAQ